MLSMMIFVGEHQRNQNQLQQYYYQKGGGTVEINKY